MRAASESVAAAAAAAALALAVALGLPVTAHAQPSAAATATLQFDKGRALMKEKKYAEACAAFEQSQKLDPQLGTLYNLGICYAELGKVASAWNAYREVGQRDANPSRKKEANRRAKDLEKRLPKLLLTIDDAPPGLVVKMNGVDVTAFVGADSPVDPAEYELVATAPGYDRWETTAEISAEGKTVTVEIELERGSAESPGGAAATKRPRRGARARAPERQDDDRPPAPSGGRKRAAIVLGLSGVASIAAGLVLGVQAGDKWEAARELCGGDTVCEDPFSLMQGNALVDEAQLRANFSTGLVIGGILFAGIGATLWLTAPSAKSSTETAIRIAPQIGPGHAAITLGGRFP